MSDKIDPLEPLRVLQQRIKDILEPRGIHLENFMVIPNPDPRGPNLVQIVGHLTEDAFKDDEQKQFDQQFAEIEMHERKEERDRQLAQARDEARKQIENLANGFLDDND